MADETFVQIVKIHLVSSLEKEKMFGILREYFAHVEYDTFLKDLGEKHWVIVLRGEGNQIVGFSTIQVIEHAVDGREVVYVFSGDTIVEKEFWQSNLLAPAFGHFMLRMMEEYTHTPVYWFLISKGYRTYRFLPVYFRKFYPVYTEATPPDYDRLLKHICTWKFGPCYNPGKGIISFDGAKDHLNDEMCMIPESKKNNLHIRFFLEKNPYYYRGDELACIADISRENLNDMAYRVIADKSVQWVE